MFTIFSVSISADSLILITSVLTAALSPSVKSAPPALISSTVRFVPARESFALFISMTFESVPRQVTFTVDFPLLSAIRPINFFLKSIPDAVAQFTL